VEVFHVTRNSNRPGPLVLTKQKLFFAIDDWVQHKRTEWNGNIGLHLETVGTVTETFLDLPTSD
jgi:hypothetical protein